MKLKSMITPIVMVSTLLILTSCFSADSGKSYVGKNDDTASAITLDDSSYLLKLPANYQPEQQYKLLLVFHGSGGRASGIQGMTQFENASDDYIVAYPNSREIEWNEGCDCNIAHRKKADDLGFVDKVIADVKSKYQLIDGEIYAAGFSQGGLFTQNLACNRSEVFKAVAVVAGSMSYQLADSCAPTKPVSVLMVHGEADAVLPYYGSNHSNFGLITSPAAIELHANLHNGLPYPLKKALENTDAGLISYTNGVQKFQLVHVENGGHSWSFAKFDTTNKILAFFANLAKPELPEHSMQLTVAEQQFHVRAMGSDNSGPAVVLLAGPNQNYHSDSAWFAALQPLLAQSYRVYSIDRLGNAFSSTADTLSYQRFADDLAAVLQQLGEQQIVLVAFSSASITASRFYQQYQQQFDLKAMLYIDPDIPLPHSLSLYQSYPADWYLANLEALLPQIATGAWNERTLTKIQQEHEQAVQLVAQHPQLMDWSYYEQISQQRLLIPHQQARAREIATYIADLNSYAQLPMVTSIPVSVIDSDFELADTENATAEELAALRLWQQEGTSWSKEQASLSNGQYIALADSEHLVPLQQPYKVQQALDWLFAQLQLP